MDFWEKVKADIRKGIREGVGLVKEGAAVVKEKAEELTEEGKKRLRILDLKMKAEGQLSELGGRVYAISPEKKNPASDSKVKAIIARIKKLEAQIAKLEGAPRGAVKKTSARRTTRSKSK